MRATPLLVITLVSLVLLGIGLAITAAQSGIPVVPDRVIEGGHPEQGRRAVVKYGCGGCHVIPGIRGARGKVGPSLENTADRAYIAGNLPNIPENLVLWIMNPQEIEPGTAMPDLRVSEEDAISIAAYLYGID